MKNIVIRKASLKDQTVLLGLEQQVIEAERPFNSSIKPTNAAYYDLKDLLTSDAAQVLVAECEAQIIATGYAQIRGSKQSLNHDKHAYLGFMFVAEDHRGLGINKQILQRLIDWSKTQGITDLYLDVYDGNEAAVRAYEKAGFVKSMVEMKLDLEQTGD
jgi:GNAT superfamily N-acetyltransferase